MIIAFQTLIYFRESLLTALDWLIPIWPYYKKWALTKNGEVSDNGDEEHVFADFDDEKGVVFFPPVYAQRYAAVADCLMDERWAGKITKVVDFGYNDTSFIKYLKDVPGIKCILGVDIESLHLRCSSDLLSCDDYAPRRETPLQITLYQGNAADPDYRLIGCDAVVAIEMIEHMLPHDLERLVHNVFGFIKPQIAVFTTPNGDFNVLFKALEKNGLRRLDHFFEWTREQFHDWCSNIVARYPDYTVTCKGIGPGPAGTQRFGCCSQLALFICKDYHKQPDLDINCLALVANAPKHNELDEMTDSWESPDPITETNMLCAPENCDSYADLLFSEKQSYMTIVLDSPDPSLENLEYKDQISQCNIELERGKGFLMFDEEILCYNVLVPQRKITSRVYEFEDVASRLNCTTHQVRKFSKTTQNLLAKNKLDSLVHSREIVDEIRHMTKMLNFNKNSLNPCSIEDSSTWNNINWGDNAPYWNEYYKVVKEFNYPFETKSDECRILDLISDEINKLIDIRDNKFAVDVNKLEIPLEHLMQVVKHITHDAYQVKDLLEWNGYEIVDDVLIYSRLVVDNTSMGSMDDDWQDNDVLSDWDTTDVQSLSDGSTMMPDIYGRSVRRAIDLKLKKLRSLLTADEDITTELDRIVCRLMKLALRTTEDHHTPPPASWMQRKLLDLLSLTEKGIERRRKYSIENYPLKAIGFDYADSMRRKIKNDDIADKIVDKYLMLSPSKCIYLSILCLSPFLLDQDNEQFVVKSEIHYTEDNLSATSNEMDSFMLEPRSTYGEVRLESMKSESKEEIRLEITQAWVDEDFDIVSPNDVYTPNSNAESSLSNTSNDSQYRYERTHKKSTQIKMKEQEKSDMQVSSKHKISRGSKSSKIKGRHSKNKLIKKLSKKHSSSGQLAKKYSKKIEFEYKSYTFNKPKQDIKEHHNLQSNSSKPIPRSLIELCYQDLSTEKSEKLINSTICNEDNNIIYSPGNVAATKESFFIDIVTEDIEETIALRRSIATEVDYNSDVVESEAILETVISVTKDDSLDFMLPIEAVNSETIFLNDLNEPSTSKGIRHVSADAQCGTDILALCPTPSAVSSLMNAPNICETGIKIGDSLTNLRFNRNSVNFGTLTDENICCDFLSAFKKKPVKIFDSDTNLGKNVECSTMTQDYYSTLDADVKLLTSISNFQNTKDSSFEAGVYGSLSKTRFHCLKIPSDTGMSQNISLTKYVRPKLSYCGIHVHSYRDRHVSEDIIFQGEWKRNGPKILAKKSPCAHTISRKRDVLIKKKTVESKEKICPRKQDKKYKVAEKKYIPKQNTKYTRTTQAILPKDYKRSFVANSLPKKEINNRTVTKVASKLATSIMPSRSAKNIKNKPLIKHITMKEYNKNIKQIDDSLRLNDNKRKPVIKIDNLNKSTDCTKKLTNEKNFTPCIVRSKTGDLKDSLLKFNKEKKKNLTYLVFRNEIENSRSENSSSANTKALTKLNNSKNNYSPPSQNSSPCSSPNSIATVRALPIRTNTDCNKKNSSSPEKANLGNISTDNFENGKNKKYVKNSKSSKMVDLSSVSHENKENLPETSNIYDKRLIDKPSKVMINDRNKKVFMLQVRAESPMSITRKKSECITQGPNSPNSKLLRNKNPDNHQKILSSSPGNKTPSNKKCKSSTRCKGEKPEINYLTRSSTPILDSSSTIHIEEQQCTNVQISNTKYIRRSNSKINAAMKQLIEERLSFIKKIQDKNDSDSETVILTRDDHYESLNESSSPISYKTVVNNENTCNISGSDLQNALLNYSFESDLETPATMGSSHSRLTSIDTDLLSFTSTDYDAHNDLDNTLVPQQSSNGKTVRDIFERKDQHIMKNTGGVLAVQVFSGFSMDGEPVVGDQPEYINLVDPETGNLALEIARQTTSEELFVSGRSSDTYESCYVEDDAFVPNWLFHIISQQQSRLQFQEEIPEDGQELPDPFEPPNEPEYDMNGNMMDAGFGVGVGAGDGRGMHSDQSQDSSGRGTSISSSDVSSGPQSEAVLIDPSAFLGAANNTVPMIGPPMPAESSDSSFRTVETIETDNETHYARENIQRRMNRVPAASDVDADVSSLETDAADSDN
ncbi:uncharacterized protein Hen1 [Epargyreus clarus]|uniref:uncharacterized protein Hen1 n=1 Tax=Epargyreus clarus TaxID=520877 RepID=UPI003C2D1070